MQVSRSNSGSTRTNNGKPPQSFCYFCFSRARPPRPVLFLFFLFTFQENMEIMMLLWGGGVPSLPCRIPKPSLLPREYENKNAPVGGGGVPSLPCPIPKHNAYYFGGRGATSSGILSPRRPYLVYSGLRRPRTQNADRNPFPPKALSSLFWVYAAPNAKRRID